LGEQLGLLDGNEMASSLEMLPRNNVEYGFGQFPRHLGPRKGRASTNCVVKGLKWMSKRRYPIDLMPSPTDGARNVDSSRQTYLPVTGRQLAIVVEPERASYVARKPVNSRVGYL
jgi:hypothetical protein